MKALTGIFAATVVLLSSAAPALAGTKEECLEAHGRGQVEREKGQLSRARHTFTTCAQSACPSIVQADCSKMSEELARVIPSVTFVARDASGADLPATSVFVDDALVASRLDEGKAYELDPGKHVVRFVGENAETTLRVVLNQGEKGRVLLASLVPPPAPAASRVSSPHPRRSLLPLGVAGVGAAALATGVVIAAVGVSSVPGSCSISTNECATAANDPAIRDAGNGMSLANTGIGIGIAGAALLAGGVVWYLMQPPHADGRQGRVRVPGVFTF